MAEIITVGVCPRCDRERRLVAHGRMCQDCLDAIGREDWQELIFRVRLDVGTYGSVPDVDEIAYLLRMGGIAAEPVLEPDTSAAAPSTPAPETPATCPTCGRTWYEPHTAGMLAPKDATTCPNPWHTAAAPESGDEQ